IMANNNYPADFIFQNLMIQNAIIHQSYVYNVKKLLFLGSSCVYPKHCPQPMKEAYLMTGPLEPTNSSYAIAKISGIEMCWAYNRQYQTQFIPVMPTNTFGPNDHYGLETSHVLPALIRKFHEAKERNEDSVTIWGTGSPKREFIHVDDIADACVFIMNKKFNKKEYLRNPLFNIGTGKDISIKDLAYLIKDISGFKGNLLFDSSKPDGTPQKLLDMSRMQHVNWTAKISLSDGIEQVYKIYKSNS
ncbi:MAG: GDP-L-fucose synthase, partial [Desulfobacula sp.]|nr:GDP-L-fucose synthase [Desulfobacula sp.]